MKASSVNKINRTSSLVLFSFVLVFGIIFLFFSVKLMQQKIPENYVETQAKITEIEEIPLYGHTGDDSDTSSDEYEYQVFVEYSYDGRTYEDVEYGNYDSSMKEGDTVLVYVNPDAPEEFMCDPSGRIVFLFIGIAITLGGIGGIGYNIYSKKKENK